MKKDLYTRKQLISLLTAGDAHMSFKDAVANFPEKHINTKPPNISYTFWGLIEHLRISQKDIYDYMTNPKYQEMTWPDEFWPNEDKKATQTMWHDTVDSFLKDQKSIVTLIQNPKTDLFAPIPWGDGDHTLFREVLVLADHNAYHIGELSILRQVAGAWNS